MPPAHRPGEPSVAAGLATALLISLLVTLVMAWPVVTSPRTMIFGHEIAGRHHDPFTVMQQFSTGGAAPPYRQPLTDDLGVGLARAIGPIPAYNVLVLITFPLTVLTTYALGRYLLGSHAGAMVAALAFGFSPVHVAHAAYHVHIAQTQWIPAYLLALFAAVDRPTIGRLAVLIASVAVLVLSNFYAGLIGALITPVGLPLYWVAQGRARRSRNLMLPAGALALGVVAALFVVSRMVPDLLGQSHRFAFAPQDVVRYGARWWAYLLPPIDHPLLGGIARRVFGRSESGPAILELQLSLGWSLTALAAVGVWASLDLRLLAATNRTMLAIAAIALWSFAASLAPPTPACLPESLAPACMAHRMAPMFRAYARVGIVTSLCVALLAGNAVASVGRRSKPRWLGQTGRRSLLGAALVVVLVEYWPLPGRARDILPTAGHRWLAERTMSVRALDCTQWTPADAALPWLMKKDIELLAGPIDRCDDPELVPKLAARTFTHVLTRSSGPAAWPVGALPEGLSLAATFPDAQVYQVSAVAPPLVVLDVRGFFGWETRDGDRWRWMGQEGSWTLVNTTTGNLEQVLHVELESFAEPRHLVLELDGHSLPSFEVAVSRREYRVGPLSVPPGQHALRFRVVEPAARPSDVSGVGDRRPMTIAVRPWRWSPATQ